MAASEIVFLLNDQLIRTTAPPGSAMLDFVRKKRHLTGSKLVCKEGECGACTVLVGNLSGDELVYQSMTSCIMPLVNAHGKHIVTIEGLNMDTLSPVQQAMVDSYGTQCGFCTPGFVVSLSGYLLSAKDITFEGAIGAIDGNICRCTGYKSIERAARSLVDRLIEEGDGNNIRQLVKAKYIPSYFSTVKDRLEGLLSTDHQEYSGRKLGGGTDLYVQRPYEMYESEVFPVYDASPMKQIELKNGICTFGAALTMGDLYRSKVFARALPNADYIFKLLSSTQIRNMATIGGNLVNASPIGDFTILLLALNSKIHLEGASGIRTLPLSSFYLGYKKLDLNEDEILLKISFPIPNRDTIFHFEKVSQRKYFDIASVNLASSIEMTDDRVRSAHIAIGGVGPIPLYLRKTATHLQGKTLDSHLVEEVFDILQSEISPISDARGSAEYKRLLARQLLLAQFLNINAGIYQIEKLIHV